MWRSEKEVRDLRLKVVKKQHMRRILCKWFLRVPKAVNFNQKATDESFCSSIIETTISPPPNYLIL